MGWGEKLVGLLTHARDAGASVAVEKWLARELQEYGELQRVDINSREKKLELDILLKGEAQPVHLRVDQYEIVQTNGRTALLVKAVTASRPWLQSLLNNFLVGTSISIPEQYAKFARLVL
jgi:hypothetical protein